MLGARRRHALVVARARPVGEQIGAQRAQLRDGDLLGLVGRGAAGDRLIHQIGDGVQPRGSVRTRGKARVQRWARDLILRAFIVHEPLYLYRILQSTRLKLSSVARQF